MSRLSSELRARVLADVAKTAAPTRKDYRQRVLAIGIAASLLSLALFVAAGGVARGVRPLASLLLTSGSGFAAMLVLLRVASGPARSMLGPPRGVLILASALVAPILALAAFAAPLIWTGRVADDPGYPIAAACVGLSLLQGGVLFAALFAVRRGADPVHPALTGMLLGAIAGAGAAAMAYLRCTHFASLHCVLGHALPTLVFVAVGAISGRSLLKIT